MVSVTAGRAHGHPQLVGLELEQQVHDRGAAVDPQLGAPGGREAADMASTTSRVW